MREFISISSRRCRLAALFVLLLLSLGLNEHLSFAAQGKTDKTLQPEEDDYSTTPFTRYGEFNGKDEEDEEVTFLQYGRFFGISLGIGFEGATGNRGLLYKGGFPFFDFQFHYWFDFNFALDLDLNVSNFNHDNPPGDIASGGGSPSSISLITLGLDLRYYIDVRNLSAPLTFINPYLIFGFGAYTKNESYANIAIPSTSETSLGIRGGAGFEFVLKPKKTYLQLEGKLHSVNFSDTHTQAYNVAGFNIPDQTGIFYSMSCNFLFTW